MILTTYKVLTPNGGFEAQWDEDDEIPVQYVGDADAIAAFKAFLDLGTVSGREGALVRFDTLEPADLYGFCQSDTYGITVLPTADDFLDEMQQEQEPDVQPILDSASDAETFALIGEGAQLLAGLDENDASFFDNLRRLREIIVALGDPAPAVEPEPTPEPEPVIEPVIEPEPVIDPSPVPVIEPETTDMQTQVETVDKTPVVDLVQPLPEDGVVIPPAEGETPDANPQRTTDLTYLADVQAKNIDLWADDTVADRIEAIAGLYAGDSEVETAIRAAIDTYTNFMAKALAEAG